MSIHFIDRKEELSTLIERYDSGRAEFIVIYGRRRVGKTELIKEFFKGKEHVYYLANKTDDKLQLKKLTERTANSFHERAPLIEDWSEFFEYLSEKAGRERLIFVIDEFPYLIASNKAIPSLFQGGWDEHLRTTRIFFLLCGSSIAMMELKVLGHKSPLYGRRTGQLKIQPLGFKEARLFFEGLDIKSQIINYSILGGIPLYLNEFNAKKDLFSNIKQNILRKDSILYEEPSFLLKGELREPTTYFLILETLSKGSVRLNEISTKTYIDVHKLPKYLGVLENLRYVKRIYPVTEKKSKPKNSLYVIRDNFFRFWFRFVYPYLSDIEEGDIDAVISVIRRDLDSFVSFSFENICEQFLRELKKKNGLPFKFSKIGKWWHRGNEIDIVAINPETKEILFAECKWRNKPVGVNTYRELREKSKMVNWYNDERKEYFALFSKTGFTPELRKENVLLFDLKDFEIFKENFKATKSLR